MCQRPTMAALAASSEEDVSFLADDLQGASARLLTDALSQVFAKLDHSDEVRRFISARCAQFVEFSQEGEHSLDWTQIHAEYCTLVERAIDLELQCLGCPEDAVLEHAAHGGSDAAAHLLTRLLAKTDYMYFCEMMHAEAHAQSDDDVRDDDSCDSCDYEYVEADGGRLHSPSSLNDEAAGEDDEDDEDLESLALQVANLRMHDLLGHEAQAHAIGDAERSRD
mmetsp:Transcript_7195/g.18779  ORF Transcript_7195/g.18779 Transcript_7195/m.18779 type:complete len:223 (+) Transcript_7195:21-689(+)